MGPEFGLIAGAEPAIFRKAFAVGVQVAADLGSALEPEFLVDDFPFQAAIDETEKGGACVGAFRASYPGLAGTKGLD